MTRILLMVPPSTDNDITTRGSAPHIGLAYLAAYLREKDIEVELIDSPIEGITFKDLRKKIRNSKPDVIGITANTMQIFEANKTAKIIKNIDKDLPVIIGGYHATAIPIKTLEEFTYFNYLVYGEGEITTYELIKKLENGKDISKIKGITYRNNDKIKITAPQKQISNLDDLPFPAFDLFPLKKYKPFYSFEKNTIELPIITGRGCPYNCTFCARPMGNRVRYRSIGNILKEIKRDIDEFGVNQIHFMDETFTLDRKRTLRLCREIIKEKINRKLKWICETRVDKVDKETLRLMSKSGCRNILYGIESGNDKILNIIKKNITTKQSKNAVKLAKEAGINVIANFIIGLPYETKETIMDTINFAVKNDIDFAIFAILTPFPGTEIIEMAKKGEGNLEILTFDWRKYSKQIGGALSLKNLSRRELEHLQMLAYTKFYLRPNKINNLLKITNTKAIFLYAFHKITNIFS